MRRMLAGAGTVTAVVALFASLPAAATHLGAADHDPNAIEATRTVDEVEAVCAVDGGVTGLSVNDHNDTGQTPDTGHNSYVFTDTVIACIDVKPGGPNTTGVFDVDASGTSDGHDNTNSSGYHNPLAPFAGSQGTEAHGNNNHHGENCASSWSPSDELGTITVTGPLGGSGNVNFTRLESDVNAWGDFTGGDAAGLSWHADLEFVPPAAELVAACGQKTNGATVTSARLTGTAYLFTT